MKTVLEKIEEYQEVTGIEGDNIDKLKLYVKCFYIKSKFLDTQDKDILAKGILRKIKSEFIFCDLTDNYEAIDILIDMEKQLKLSMC